MYSICGENENDISEIKWLEKSVKKQYECRKTTITCLFDMEGEVASIK